MLNPTQYKQVKTLKNQVESVVDYLEQLDDTTYDMVNDFTDQHGRYEDLLDWLQYLSNIR